MHEYDSIKKYKDARKFMNVIEEKKTEMERDIQKNVKTKSFRES